MSSTYTSTTSTATSTSSSDIDWSGLIEEAVAAKLTKADTIELKITDNEATIAAYQELQTLLQDLADAANALRAPSGSSSTADNAFLNRAAYLSENGDVDASASAAATIEDGAATGSYDLTISQIAKSHKVAGGTMSSITDELGYDGVITLGTDAGTSSQITITSDMTLDEVAEAINAKTDASGVKASVLKVSDTDYRLILSGAETGNTLTAASVSGDDLLTGLGILDSGGFADELQAAQQAIFAIDGIEITRSGNDVDDAIDGITLHLYQQTPDDTSITLEIGTDLSTVKQAITTLVDAYNAYREFAFAQQQAPTGDEDDDSVLFGDGTLRNVNSGINSALTAMIGGDSMALLGLTFDENNALVLDEDTLDDALLNDADAVESLLTFSMTSSSAKLLMLARGTNLVDDVTLDITVDENGAVSSVGVDGNPDLFTISGTRIIGAEGTKYEGYTFVYAGSSSLSVDLSFQTGIAELLYNATDGVSDTSEGILETLIETLKDTNETLSTEVDDITERAETYRTNLTTRYAEYQAAIESAESMLEYLTTLIDTWNNS
ncbi:MAG: flagellar filament capping protein FliD [Alphaproteobacteria bacterium]|nr:flagellar filament capping protein FliD [Alphaproteobacteria bacterium]